MKTPHPLSLLLLAGALAACGSVDLAASDATSAPGADTKVTGDDSGTPGPSADATDSTDGIAINPDTDGGDSPSDGDTSADGDAAREPDTTSEDIATEEVTDGSDEDTTVAEDVAAAPSRCTTDEGVITCPFETKTLDIPVGLITEARDVLYATPLTDPPAGGFPVVLLFHGAAVEVEYFWNTAAGLLDIGGLTHQVGTVKALLDAGFAVVTPRAEKALTYWNTNVPPWLFAWTTAPDHTLMTELLAAIADGTFGDLDADRLYASGISSGAYMASRVALTYPGVRAIAIHSGSYMECGGAVCTVPELEASHPPALFLHGEADPIVPLWTMELYRDALTAAGVATKTVTDPALGHEWLPGSPEAISEWFLDHP